MWRSLPRAALTDTTQVANLFQEYAANQIYVYPAHEDYGRSHGDLITANTPYMLISVGSSGSDRYATSEAIARSRHSLIATRSMLHSIVTAKKILATSLN